MVKRYRKRPRAASSGLGVFWVLFLIAGFISLLARYPVILLIAIVGGCGYFGLRRYYRHQKQVAEVARQRRLAEIQAEQSRRMYEIRAEQSRQIAPYMGMDPREFEEALAFLCHRDGCPAAQVVGGAGDLGADVIATTPQGWRLVIQAKRYSQNSLVTGPDLQKFGGTCFAVHQADVAVVVTTSGFTRQAREYAARINIGLYDREALAGWASRTGPPPWAAALSQLPVQPAIPMPPQPLPQASRGRHARPETV